MTDFSNSLVKEVVEYLILRPGKRGGGISNLAFYGYIFGVDRTKNEAGKNAKLNSLLLYYVWS